MVPSLRATTVVTSMNFDIDIRRCEDYTSISIESTMIDE